MLSVFLKTARLMPATIELTAVSAPGVPDWTGTGATPHSSSLMPCALSVVGGGLPQHHRRLALGEVLQGLVLRVLGVAGRDDLVLGHQVDVLLDRRDGPVGGEVGLPVGVEEVGAVLLAEDEDVVDVLGRGSNPRRPAPTCRPWRSSCRRRPVRPRWRAARISRRPRTSSCCSRARTPSSTAAPPPGPSRRPPPSRAPTRRTGPCRRSCRSSWRPRAAARRWPGARRTRCCRC